MAPRTGTAPERLEALTGLRFLAAFHVVLFHVSHWERWPGTRVPGTSTIP
jgi:peptidoglycan/LPS O-acetylase OafA/YrhL